ncbi:TnsA-like heteromeric transposase endonuclease subunit [Streptantibioticus ferralitis]|uniref:TnsA-like heteromeric transposase endonuclease subunit n=1 Tax=Streptantibioticus ferralitis TaxID=236510 RepID=A0ABT5YSG5_9ACTN|nr:TnsA-like heteromeric transposase endonuclease subunit [Streptantibioticus ferralitis]MDF2254546.1 TnsA-like heteromeric transposase endonuclease subunit [Streptantibioticus ferralitis]
MVRALGVLPGGAAGPSAEGFEVAYIDPGGSELRRPLADVWAVRFEDAAPVREFKSYEGQRHLPGLWWSSTAGGHVGYESWLERDHVMLLDFDPAVVGISSQPFWLFWASEAGKGISHAPDYFARRGDGCAVVVDCRPADRRGPRDWAKFEATQTACDQVGWEFRLVGAPDAVVVRNVRWLAGYRHPRHWLEPVVRGLREVFAEPRPLMEGAAAVGDSVAVLPVLFHLLWSHELAADVAVPLRAESLVSPGVRR